MHKPEQVVWLAPVLVCQGALRSFAAVAANLLILHIFLTTDVVGMHENADFLDGNTLDVVYYVYRCKGVEPMQHNSGL